MKALRGEMTGASERQDYERAAGLRDKVKAIERTMESQKMAAFARTDLDLVGLARRDNQAAVQLFVIRGGKAIGRDVFLLDVPKGTPDAEVMSGFLLQYYGRATSVPREIAVPLVLPDADDLEDFLAARRGAAPGALSSMPLHDMMPDERAASASENVAMGHASEASSRAASSRAASARVDSKDRRENRTVARPDAVKTGRRATASGAPQPVSLVVPRRGERRRLMELATRNAEEMLAREQAHWLADQGKTLAALQELADALSLPTLPARIECYDISNFQGSETVASMVVFEDGKPRTGEYRRFRIRTVQGPNDFASHQEVLRRRFKLANRGDEGSAEERRWAMPDLVIVDGGRGQVSAAKEVLDELSSASATKPTASRSRTTATSAGRPPSARSSTICRASARAAAAPFCACSARSNACARPRSSRSPRSPASAPPSPRRSRRTSRRSRRLSAAAGSGAAPVSSAVDAQSRTHPHRRSRRARDPRRLPARPGGARREWGQPPHRDTPRP